jgi:hypothetical protein
MVFSRTLNGHLHCFSDRIKKGRFHHTPLPALVCHHIKTEEKRMVVKKGGGGWVMPKREGGLGAAFGRPR